MKFTQKQYDAICLQLLANGKYTQCTSANNEPTAMHDLSNIFRRFILACNTDFTDVTLKLIIIIILY